MQRRQFFSNYNSRDNFSDRSRERADREEREYQERESKTVREEKEFKESDEYKKVVDDERNRINRVNTFGSYGHVEMLKQDGVVKDGENLSNHELKQRIKEHKGSKKKEVEDDDEDRTHDGKFNRKKRSKQNTDKSRRDDPIVFRVKDTSQAARNLKRFMKWANVHCIYDSPVWSTGYYQTEIYDYCNGDSNSIVGWCRKNCLWYPEKKDSNIVLTSFALSLGAIYRPLNGSFIDGNNRPRYTLKSNICSPNPSCFSFFDKYFKHHFNLARKNLRRSYDLEFYFDLIAITIIRSSGPAFAFHVFTEFFIVYSKAKMLESLFLAQCLAGKDATRTEHRRRIFCILLMSPEVWNCITEFGKDRKLTANDPDLGMKEALFTPDKDRNYIEGYTDSLKTKYHVIRTYFTSMCIKFCHIFGFVYQASIVKKVLTRFWSCTTDDLDFDVEELQEPGHIVNILNRICRCNIKAKNLNDYLLQEDWNYQKPRIEKNGEKVKFARISGLFSRFWSNGVVLPAMLDYFPLFTYNLHKLNVFDGEIIIANLGSPHSQELASFDYNYHDIMLRAWEHGEIKMGKIIADDENDEIVVVPEEKIIENPLVTETSLELKEHFEIKTELIIKEESSEEDIDEALWPKGIDFKNNSTVKW